MAKLITKKEYHVECAKLIPKSDDAEGTESTQRTDRQLIVAGDLKCLPSHPNKNKEIKMGKRSDLIQYMFAGQSDPLAKIIVLTGSATGPNGVITAPQGTFYIMDYTGNAVNHDVWINTDASTTWVQIHDET